MCHLKKREIEREREKNKQYSTHLDLSKKKLPRHVIKCYCGVNCYVNYHKRIMGLMKDEKNNLNEYRNKKLPKKWRSNRINCRNLHYHFHFLVHLVSGLRLIEFYAINHNHHQLIIIASTAESFEIVSFYSIFRNKRRKNKRFCSSKHDDEEEKPKSIKTKSKLACIGLIATGWLGIMCIWNLGRCSTLLWLDFVCFFSSTLLGDRLMVNGFGHSCCGDLMIRMDQCELFFSSSMVLCFEQCIAMENFIRNTRLDIIFELMFF